MAVNIGGGGGGYYKIGEKSNIFALNLPLKWGVRRENMSEEFNFSSTQRAPGLKKFNLERQY